MRRFVVMALWFVPFLLWIECSVRPMTEPDLFFYFALIENYLRTGHWPSTDPFLYSLANDSLMTLHQWLGYWVFYAPFKVFGWAGPIFLKTLLVGILLILPLIPYWRFKKPIPDYFPLIWTIAIFITHHRFRERVSLFGDLFTLMLVSGLFWAKEKRWFWYSLPLLFLTWAQLHPSYPLGWVILGAFLICSGRESLQKPRLISAGACLLAPFLNPMGWQGVAYPFQFSLEIEPYLRQYVVEWLPLTDPRVFQFHFLYLPFFITIPFLAWMMWHARKMTTPFAWFIFVLAIVLTTRSVRFGLMAQGMLLVLLGWLEFQLVEPSPRFKGLRQNLWYSSLAILSILVMSLKVSSSSTWGKPFGDRLKVETSYFPEESANILTTLNPKLHIFNSFGFGGYLAWRWGGNPPIFFHGFSTNFKFFEDHYNKPQESQANLDAEIRQWDIGVFLLSKLGNDDNFIILLNKHPGWQKIHEDLASVIFVKRDPRVFGP